MPQKSNETILHWKNDRKLTIETEIMVKPYLRYGIKIFICRQWTQRPRKPCKCLRNRKKQFYTDKIAKRDHENGDYGNTVPTLRYRDIFLSPMNSATSKTPTPIISCKQLSILRKWLVEYVCLLLGPHGAKWATLGDRTFLVRVEISGWVHVQLNMLFQVQPKKQEIWSL